MEMKGRAESLCWSRPLGAGFLAALGNDRPLEKGIFALSLGGSASPGGNGILFGDLRGKKHLLSVGMNAGGIKCCGQISCLEGVLEVTLDSFSPSPHKQGEAH